MAFDAEQLAKGMDLADCSAVEDEQYLTAVLPQKLGLKSVAVGAPVAAHLAYWPQREGLQEEALLAAYAAL